MTSYLVLLFDFIQSLFFFVATVNMCVLIAMLLLFLYELYKCSFHIHLKKKTSSYTHLLIASTMLITINQADDQNRNSLMKRLKVDAFFRMLTFLLGNSRPLYLIATKSKLKHSIDFSLLFFVALTHKTKHQTLIACRPFVFYSLG